MKNYGTVRQATDDIVTLCVHIAWWIIKAVYAHSEYVILIAFPRQQRLSERASMLHYKYIACLVRRNFRFELFPV